VGQGEIEMAEPVVVPEKAQASCALAAWHDRVHLAWTGSDLRINVAQSHDAASFGGKQTLRHRTATTVSDSSFDSSVGHSTSSTRTVPLAPALTGAGGDLHLAWTGTDSRLNLWRVGAGDAGHAVLRERSELSPALGSWGPELVVVWIGRDHHLNVMRTQGMTLAAPVRLDETSHVAPATCGAGDEVVVAWTGTDRHLNVLWSAGGRLAAPLRLEQTSGVAPAVCVVAGTIVVAWTGTDRHLNVMALTRGMPRPTRLDARSNHAPALCPHDGGALVAWTGSDTRPNVARLRFRRP
jgi:hypothetical protein